MRKVIMIIGTLALLFFNINCEKEDIVKVVKIEIICDNNEVKEYKSILLSAKVILSNNEIDQNKTVTWSSLNPTKAKVNKDGVVTGISEGTAKISAFCDNVNSEVEITVLSNPIQSLDIINFPDTLIVSKTIDIEVEIHLETGDILSDPDFNITWSIDDDNAAIITGNTLLGIKEKIINITGSIGEIYDEKTIFISAIEDSEIPLFLSTPANNSIYEIPVIIIRHLPTADGINLDVSKAPDYWSLGEISLEDLISNIDNYDLRIKYSLEEGSRFRGYKNNSAAPSLGYKVIKYFTVFEHTPKGIQLGLEEGWPIYLPNFHEIFERFGIENYVNNLGVKEIWFWQSHFGPATPSYSPEIHSPDVFRALFESNMSSPTTGDISNSYQDMNDLPIYNYTYTVYGQNFRRSQAEAVHNHGHQLERLLTYAEVGYNGSLGISEMFWQKFVGNNANGSGNTGRCGWTHSPPNTTMAYDYQNTTLVESDIEDWKPDNSGEKKLVNVDTWGTLTYGWPGGQNFSQQTESQWYIYWMQNMPGYQNNIPFSVNKNMTNWWIFTADWDYAISHNLGLVE